MGAQWWSCGGSFLCCHEKEALHKPGSEEVAPAKFSDGRRPRVLGLAKPQDTPTINQIQMRIEGRDCSEDKVPRVWLATAGGSRHRDVPYSAVPLSRFLLTLLCPNSFFVYICCAKKIRAQQGKRSRVLRRHSRYGVARQGKGSMVRS